MATEIKMPQLSDTMHSGKIIAWHKNEGDQVSRGDILAEVETDKATLEIESFHQGVLLKIAVPAQTNAAVGEIIAFVGEKNEVIHSGIQTERPAPPNEPLRNTDPTITTDSDISKSITLAPPTPLSAEAERIKASPLAKRLAKEHGIDLRQIRGSGPGGRIIRKDLLESNPEESSLIPATKSTQQTLPLSKMRQTIAQRMQSSFSETPHFYLSTSINMQSVLQLRKELKDSPQFAGLSVTHFIVAATAYALTKEPLLNCAYRAGQLYQPVAVNIGLVELVADGLLIPVIKDANQLSLSQIISQTRAALERARSGKLHSADLNEGTFTISNLGKYNVENFTAIINPGQGAILAVARISDQAIVEDAKVQIRPILKVTLSVDHRVCDGVKAAQFLEHLKSGLEQPALLFVL